MHTTTETTETNHSVSNEWCLGLFLGVMLLICVMRVYDVCFQWPKARGRQGIWFEWRTFFGNSFPMSRLGAFFAYSCPLNILLFAWIRKVMENSDSFMGGCYLVIAIFSALSVLTMWTIDYGRYLDQKRE